MTQDCIVTTLKAVVNDDNLNFLGFVKIKMNAPAGSLVNINVNYGESDGTLKIIGDGYFVSNNEKEITVSGNNTIGVSVGTSYILLIQKNGLLTIGFGSTNTYAVPLELDQLYGCSELYGISPAIGKLIGDVAELFDEVPTINSFTSYGTTNSEITGNFDKEVSEKKTVNMADAPATIVGDVNNFKNWIPNTLGYARFQYRGTGITGELSTLFDYIATHSTISTMIILPNTLTTLNGVATTATEKTVTFSNGSWSIS